ncbi:minor capsid protein [Aeribacillus composti]|uniref:Putative Cro/Cl-type repressor n=1 Tax=Anoxybacillus phage A403 TaxID=2099336 RepID=A0A2P1JTW9_9CAUD|nr:minor head protein [Anoxybacillus phage A403]AVO22583.1 putative Cro/Cl-type repressor [Anoxybacillus phage A403]
MTNNYWRDRELEHIKKSIKNDAKLAKRLRQKYMEALEEIQQQIEVFYGRYADKEGISIDEVRKRARKLDIEKYAKKAARYVKLAHTKIPFLRWMAFTDKANSEMAIYNLTMKVNRLELLKLNVELELYALLNDEDRFLYEELTKQAKAEYERQSGILGQSIAYNEKHIESIVNSSFLTATWSDRIWANQDALRQELDKLLNRGILQGKNPRELARDLRKVFDTSVYNSERLLRTELARVQQDVFQDCMKKAEIEQYEYIAEPDACPICKKLDGKIFNLDEAQVGVNAYPMHPNCRCSQAAYVDREAWDADLRARGL